VRNNKKIKDYIGDEQLFCSSLEHMEAFSKGDLDFDTFKKRKPVD